jgi:hypothetical protein
MSKQSARVNEVDIMLEAIVTRCCRERVHCCDSASVMSSTVILGIRDMMPVQYSRQPSTRLAHASRPDHELKFIAEVFCNVF